MHLIRLGFFLVCSPSHASAPSPAQPRATLGNAGWSGHRGPAALEERAPGQADTLCQLLADERRRLPPRNGSRDPGRTVREVSAGQRGS